EKAQVTYGGNEASDVRVFRSPTGDLFVLSGDLDSVGDRTKFWIYMVRIEERTAEVAFMGTLLTRDGHYIWESNDREAYSHEESKPAERRLLSCREPDCPKLVVAPEYVEFPSTEYRDTGALIRITGDFSKWARKE